MDNNDNLQQCGCGTCAEESTITSRERILIELAYQFAVKDSSAIKQAIIRAKSDGISSEEIEEVCSLIAESSRESILSLLHDKKDFKARSCCL